MVSMFGNKLSGFDFSTKSLLALCCGFSQKSPTEPKSQRASGYDSSCDETDCITHGLKKSTSGLSDHSASTVKGSDERKKKAAAKRRKKDENTDSVVVNGLYCIAIWAGDGPIRA